MLRLGLLGLLLVLAVVGTPAKASTDPKGCIWIYWSVASKPCTSTTGPCTCGFGNPTWGVSYLVLECRDLSPAPADSECFIPQTRDYHQWLTWYNANYPKTICQDFNTVFDGCNPDADDYQCPATTENGDPQNDKSSSVGDPVSLTTGTLKRTDTDLDLGQGLVFRRHYASSYATAVASAMGTGWRHNLDWRIQYTLLASTPRVIEAAVVTRPLAGPAGFERLTTPPVGPDRTYEPASGRYLETDPVGQSGGVNVYAYAANVPAQLTDADGHNPVAVAIAACAADPACAALAGATAAALRSAVANTWNALHSPAVGPVAPPDPNSMAKGGKQRVIGSDIEALVSQKISALRLKGEKPPSRCEMMQQLIDEGLIDPYEAIPT